jgi:hypothetical protein
MKCGYGFLQHSIKLFEIQRNRRVSHKSVKGLLKQHTLKLPKLLQLDKVLCQWFRAMYSQGKPMSGRMIIEKAKSCYDEMKIADKYTLLEGWLQNLGTV